MNNGHFLDRSLKLTKGSEISFPMLIVGLIGIIYLFGSSVITDTLSLTVLKILFFTFQVSMAWAIAQHGVLNIIQELIAFSIAFWLIGAMLQKVPDKIFETDVSGFQHLMTTVGNENQGVVDLGEFSFGEKTESVTQQIVTVGETTVTNDINQGGGSPTMEQPPLLTVQPLPTVDHQTMLANQTKANIAGGNYDLAFDSATESYTLYGDDASLTVITNVQTARDIHAKRKRDLPIAVDGEFVLTMDNEERSMFLTLTENDEWLVVEGGEQYGSIPCSQNIVIELQNGIYAGQTYTVRKCVVGYRVGEYFGGE